ncbi:MAG: trypsin-like peptidase domain-containing protein [Gammaproteobacteria bacterium]|nr:trypsin-like peptidase domain-containing protein [Gammaproteobacteria bacterium]
MPNRPLLTFILQATALGLLVALVLFSVLPPQRQQVEIVQAAPSSVLLEPTQENLEPYSYRSAVQKASPSVVNIYTTKRIQDPPQYRNPLLQKFFGEEQKSHLERSLGSGVVVSSQGYIVTNNHVIKNASDILVMFSDGTPQKASLVGSDPETDLALLKVPQEDLPAITFSAAENLFVGDVVLAIGNPFGVGQTVTQGIVSATGRDRLGLSTFEDFIQTDAAINPGNSGGALINPRGELVGINTAIFSRSGGSQGIGFAIPAPLVQTVLTQLIERGEVVRGWLGVAAQDLSLRVQQKLRVQSGVLVTGIYRNGPAYRAGLEAGDIIIQLNGEPVLDVYTLLESTSVLTPGEEVQIHGLRGKTHFKARAKLVQRPVATLKQ